MRRATLSIRMTLPVGTTSIVAYMKYEGGTEVYFDDLKIELSAVPVAMVVQENHYYPFGLNMKGLDYVQTASKENKFTFNGQSEFEKKLSLNFIETPHRLLDVQLGRFLQADKLVDLFTGITPYVYAYNNPIKFNDPTGLNGETPVNRPCPECDELAEKYAARASRTGNGISMWDLVSSHNPIYRNIGLHHQRGDNNYVHRSLHGQANISAGGVTPQSQWYQDFRNAFGLALNYGLGGTLIAIYGAPILADMLMADGAMDVASVAYDVATGDYVSAGIDAVDLAVPGVNASMAKIYQYTSTNRLGHFGVEVLSGKDKLFTHQVITAADMSTTTITKNISMLDNPIKTVELSLPNATDAMKYQRGILGTELGAYSEATNSCVTHIINVLNAGGLNIPNNMRSQYSFLKELGFEKIK
ncbi:RHS repeat domain-containing protein [Thermoflexibacter ruber]|uniref:RHS repeat domain-containing protein n=1 Tax=Thermoflexibacter ruber TaxID=1003 RepID=UPI001C86CDB9|nr:RHS repeat-associated core domain-containing protein [Thermoflexibacter ruber]